MVVTHLKDRYLSAATAGDKIATLAATEPDVGSDLAALETSYTRQGNGYVLNGKKLYIANAAYADFFVVAARMANHEQPQSRDTSEVSMFVVDSNLPNVIVEKQDLSSWRCAGMASITFDNVEISAENIIGREGKGFDYLMHVFQFERLAAALIALGGADSTVSKTKERLKNRKAFEKTLSDLQTIRHKIADLATEVEASRHLLYHTAWLFQSDDWAIRECSMAKLHATEIALKAAQQCLQLNGASGCMDYSNSMRALHDESAATIAAGVSEVMRDIIALQEF